MIEASDRWNPVLLKETRQALRSRFFGILFPTTVLAAVAIAIAVIVEAHPRDVRGPAVFMPTFVVLMVAALGLVPFGAFQSMSGEWEEATHDLLVLSHMSPARIVLGKLCSSAVETSLYFSAFLPILLFTYLLPGVDVRDVLFLTGALFAGSLAMCCVAMALAGLTRVRFWRVALLAVLAGLGFLAVLAGYEVAEQFVERGRGIGSSYASDEVLATFAVISSSGAVAFALAATRIAHPEDDRSGPVRAACTLVLAGILGAIAYGASSMGLPRVFEVVTILSVVISIPAVFFVTEHERLPRLAAARVPANSLLALVRAPFVAGGGRGVLWWFTNLGLVLAFAWGLSAWHGVTLTPGAPVPAGWPAPARGETLHVLRAAGFLGYLFVYLAGISLALGALRKRPNGPLIARFVLPCVVALSILVPLFVGFLSGDQDDIEHGLWFPFQLLYDGDTERKAVFAIGVAILVFVLNLPRLYRSLRDVLAASAERRALSARRTEAVHAG